MLSALDYSLVVLMFTWPAFVLPIIVGPVILWYYKHDSLSRLAGVLTLKPLLATPIMLMLIELSNRWGTTNDAIRLISVLPGITLTLLIGWAFRRTLLAQKNIVYFILLFGADALRWLTAFACLLGNGQWDNPVFRTAWILPSAYALMALGILWQRARQPDQPDKNVTGNS